MIEKNMKLVCLTGVEDKLQDDVANTISSLKQGGTKVWMLTGDKIETAKCIACSTDLKGHNQEFAVFSSAFYLRNNKIVNDLELNLLKVEISLKKTVFVIDGDLLEHAFNSLACRSILLRIVLNAPCVLICRCSPTQKAMVVSTIKKVTNAICLSIGDGGNDVAMIQEADVGIGIFGKEGKQAALSSDFSIHEFKHLKKLLFWHGRLS